MWQPYFFKDFLIGRAEIKLRNLFGKNELKETLIKSASKIFEYVFGVKKAQNRRYTL